jgi:hypothetical protein
MRQNAAYDHVTPEEMVQMLRATVGTETGIIGPLAMMPTKLPISRDEFSRLKIPTAHRTELGFCLHDYSTTPCELHQDCINCREHVCIKGDAEKTAMLQRRLNESNAMLLASDDAKQRGALAGDDRVTLHLRQSNVRLRELCSILENPDVPEGSFIQLSNITSASRIEQADQARQSATGERSEIEMGDIATRLLKLQRAMETSS